MQPQEFWTQVEQLGALRGGAQLAAAKSTLAAFSSVRAAKPISVPWSKSLMAASLVSVEAPELLQDRALRIAQGCLQDVEASAQQQAAATYLLERLGNSRASRVARDKGLLPAEASRGLSPLSLDVVRRSLELSVDVDGRRVAVNEFQRNFWESAKHSRWLSVSAPTSAGKSFIVRLWLEARLASARAFRAVYVVPTRALIEEVSRSLEEDLGGVATVTTMPWDPRLGNSRHELLVLTQERLHIAMRRQPEAEFDLIFVDEAQKLRDGARGVLLQRALDEAAQRGAPQVIFASPLSSNPELLLPVRGPDSRALISETVTVNQTLLHVNQRPGKPRSWGMTMFFEGHPVPLGEFELPARPVPDSERLSLVAVALGRTHTGNVVYANGAAEAEKLAGQIFDALGNERRTDSVAVRNVIELVEKTIHPKYLLAQYLARGVAFHYGNMPLLIREAVEELFRAGEVSYLVCTSTLLEGVNLPCQNLFVRAPRKGNSNPMAPSDFWNLAGRAGRWGKEFQGNVICLDTDRNIWESVPTNRARQPIGRATDEIIAKWDNLVEYIETGAPVEVGRQQPILEALFGLLASTRRRGESIAEMPWLHATEERGEVLDDVVDRGLAKISVRADLLQTHADISAFSIQRLHDHFIAVGDRASLELPDPEADNAVERYTAAIDLCERLLGGDFTQVPTRHFSLALLFVQWMRGLPVAALIGGRLDWLRRNGREVKLPSQIRSVLQDVEQYARFEGPRYLACYASTLDAALPPVEGSPASIDIAMMMELGVSRRTEVAMMSLGLSRTSVVALSEHIVSDDLSPTECVQWLMSRDLEALDLPALVVTEVRNAVAKRTA